MGLEDGNAAMTEGRTLPWLQDVAEVDAWSLFQAEYRDVVVLDRQGVFAAWYNLTLHDLEDPAAYAELRDLLETIAAR